MEVGPVAIKLHTYPNGAGWVQLVACPFCGHQFVEHEPRWKHFLDEHDPSDVPALSGGEWP